MPSEIENLISQLRNKVTEAEDKFKDLLFRLEETETRIKDLFGLDKLVSGFNSRARAYSSGGSQGISNNSETKVILNAEDYDGNDEFDTTNYRFKAKKDGYYQIAACVFWTSSADQSEHAIKIKKDGSTWLQQSIIQTSGSGQFVQFLTDIVYLAKDSYIELWVMHISGVTRQVASGSDVTFMAVHRLS